MTAPVKYKVHRIPIASESERMKALAGSKDVDLGKNSSRWA